MDKLTYKHPLSGKELTDNIIGFNNKTDCYIVDRCAHQSTKQLEVPLHDVIAVIPEEDEGFKGYYGTDPEGNTFHTWDFEESIGE